MKSIITYFKQVREELQKVSWPSRQDVVRMTTVVIVASVLVGIYLAGLDYLFTTLLGFIIG